APPMVTATPTPAMLPRPTVPDTAELSAWKWLISPGSSGLLCLPRTIRSAVPKPRSWMTPKYAVKTAAASTSQPTIHGNVTPKTVTSAKMKPETASETGVKALLITSSTVDSVPPSAASTVGGGDRGGLVVMGE